jgi:hypothetical protein
MIKQIVIFLLCAVVRASNELQLISQQSITIISLPEPNLPTTVCAFDRLGTTLVAGISTNFLRFVSWDGSAFGSNYSVTFTDASIGAAVFRQDGVWMAAAGSSNTLYLLKYDGSRYSIHHSLGASAAVNCLTWAFNGERLLAGLNNGAVWVLAYNSTSDRFEESQMISTTHPTIQKISGTISRFATCSNDNHVLVYYFNLTTKQYSLNITLTTNGNYNCSALDFAESEVAIAVGKADTTLYVFERNAVFDYSWSTNLYPQGVPITSARFTDDGAQLLASTINNFTSLYSRLSTGYTIVYELNYTAHSAYWNSNFNQFALGIANGTVNVFNLRANNCSTGYTNISYPTQCSCPNQQVWQYGNCTNINCSAIVVGAVGGTTVPTSCPCSSNYQWNSTINTCSVNCSAIPHSNGTNYEYRSCFCSPSYYWNYTESNCYFNCTGLGSGSNINSTYCTCYSGFSWNLTAAQCWLDCSTMVGSTGINANQTICGCNPPFVWNPPTLNCYLDCSSINNTVGQFNDSSCICRIYYSWNLNVIDCLLNCSAIPYSNGSSNVSSCLCLNGYDWNSSATVCWINCTAQPHSNGTSIGTDACYCDIGYFWNGTAGACYRNCTGFSDSDGTNANSTVCSCTANSTWNATAEQCYFNCTGLADSDGTNAGATVCNCHPWFVWNAATAKCELNCSNVTNCGCASSQYLNTTDGLCWTNCTGQANSNQSSSGRLSCYCDQGYDWNLTAVGCRCNSSSCLADCRAQPHTQPNPDNLEQCVCLAFFVNVSGRCVVECPAVPYGSGTVGTAGECACQTGYRWDQQLSACVSGTSSTNTAVAVGVGVGVGVPVALLLLTGVAIAIGTAAAPATAAPLTVTGVSSTAFSSGPATSMPVMSNQLLAIPQQTVGVQQAAMPTNQTTFAMAPTIVVPPSKRKLRVFT